MNLSELLLAGEYIGISDTSVEFSFICHDTRKARDGCLFVALPGKKHDPLFHLKESGVHPAAIIAKQGASQSLSFSCPILFVASPHKTLALLWSRISGSPEKSMRFYGVTGTAGKSSTAEMLYFALKKSGRSVGLIGTVHCYADGCEYKELDGTATMTTPEPDTLYPLLRDMKDRGITDVVLEVSSQALAQERCAPITFDIGIFTNLSPEHLDYHETMENYFRAKASLFERANVAILNADDPSAERLKKLCRGKTVEAGIVTDGDYRAVSPFAGTSVAYTWVSRNFSCRIKLPLPGIFTVSNSLLAATAAVEAGVSPLTVKEAFAEMRMISGRMEKLDTKDFSVGYDVIIDYAHTPEALRKLLESAKPLAKRRLILVFGCGGDRDRSKRAPMGRIASKYADVIFVTADNSRSEATDDILASILVGISSDSVCRVIPDRKDAIEAALDEAKEGDLVLLAGKGHETYEIRGNLLFPFDERKIVYSYLAKKGDTPQ